MSNEQVEDMTRSLDAFFLLLAYNKHLSIYWVRSMEYFVPYYYDDGDAPAHALRRPFSSSQVTLLSYR